MQNKKYMILYKNTITSKKDLYIAIKETKNILYLKNDFNTLKVYKKSYRTFVLQKDNWIFYETAKANCIIKI